MQHRAGFTLLELIVVIAIIAIIAGIGIPNLITWRNNVKIKGAINNLRGDMELAKMKAIRENAYVVVQFASDEYTIFVDDGEGGATAGDWSRTGGELLVVNRQLAGVTIDLGSTTFNSNRTRFDGRGLPGNLGTVVITDSIGNQRQISLSLVGRLNVQ